jgi:very-short-patch-repair endonuclease
MNDPGVLNLFSGQFGVATAGQLIRAGISRNSIARATAKGSLVRVLPGLYRLAGQRMTFETRAMGAQLHFGTRAFLDGTTAGAIHGLRSMPRSLITVTTMGRLHRTTPPWIHATMTTVVIDGDIVWINGFRTAHPRRALLTLAGQFNRHRYERAAEDAWHLGLVTPSEMAEYLELVRRPGLAGVAIVDRWLVEALPRRRPSQSGLELDALEAIRLAGLPVPERQRPIQLTSGERIHLDLAWPHIQLAVEPGHTWWHGGDLRMRADAARDRACGEVGWQVIRFDQAMRDDLVGSGLQIKRTYERRRAALGR